MPTRSAASAAALAALAVLATSGCERAPTPDTDPHFQPIDADARGGNAFQVQVTLSETAAAALDAHRQRVIVSADYFGYPTVAAQQRKLPGTEDPWLRLTTQQMELDGAGSVRFPAVALDPERLQLIEQGRPQLRVDVYSSAAADGGEENLLDCGTFQGALSVAVRNGVDVDCKLIAE